jgi:hypothetical protein
MDLLRLALLCMPLGFPSTRPAQIMLVDADPRVHVCAPRAPGHNPRRSGMGFDGVRGGNCTGTHHILIRLRFYCSCCPCSPNQLARDPHAGCARPRPTVLETFSPPATRHQGIRPCPGSLSGEDQAPQASAPLHPRESTWCQRCSSSRRQCKFRVKSLRLYGEWTLRAVAGLECLSDSPSA